MSVVRRRGPFVYASNLTRQYYKLPADGQEMNVSRSSSLVLPWFSLLVLVLQRLSLQHRIWRLMVGGLFPRESEHDIRKALRQAERSLRQPYILDIGSGSGIWYVPLLPVTSTELKTGNQGNRNGNDVP